jgi:formylglycine-generating enzyme required for sulfatase activity
MTCVGDDFDGVSGDGSQDDSFEVGSVIGCKVGSAQLFDMSGNVWEWESSCAAKNGPDDDCRHRGGSFWDPESDLRCDSGKPASLASRSKFNENIGVRCCADVNP